MGQYDDRPTAGRRITGGFLDESVIREFFGFVGEIPGFQVIPGINPVQKGEVFSLELACSEALDAHGVGNLPRSCRYGYRYFSRDGGFLPTAGCQYGDYVKRNKDS